MRNIKLSTSDKKISRETGKEKEVVFLIPYRGYPDQGAYFGFSAKSLSYIAIDIGQLQRASTAPIITQKIDITGEGFLRSPQGLITGSKGSGLLSGVVALRF